VYWLERHSLLYHKVRSRVEALRFGTTAATDRKQTPQSRFQHAVDSGAAAFERGIRMYLTVARAVDAQVLVPQVVYVAGGKDAASDSVARVLWAGGYGPADVIWKGYARFDSVTRRVATELNARHVPASDSSLWRADGFTEGDPIHFNDRGAWRLAAHLAPTVREMARASGPRLDRAGIP
jgi:hypothetical protein